MIKAGIIGGTGYTGGELLRLLALHPAVELVMVTSRSKQGVRVDKLFPNLRGRLDLVFVESTNKVFKDCDVIFFAAPNGTAMQSAVMLLESGIRVIDLAADFRLKRSDDWEKWYGMPHVCPELLGEAVYGLPEINREAISRARLVANPGCYPTAIQLGFLPLLEARVVDSLSLIADTKSGISGAGRKAEIDILFSEAAENFRAYNVSGHRHWPEISQGLMRIAKGPVNFVFVPHLTPMIRGIHATLYATLIDTHVDLQNLFIERYSHEPFVDVLEYKSHPETRSVRGLNYCRLAVHRPQSGKTVVILSVIDNLVKGAAGQAVQNMNLMFGLPETAGLEWVSLVP